MCRVILAIALTGWAVLPCLTLPAAAQSGTRTPTSSGVVSGQGWNTGQDLRSSEDMNARRRAAAQRRATQNRNYPGTPTRTRGMPAPRPDQAGQGTVPAGTAATQAPPAPSPSAN
jgi:hypothetical protein